MKARQVLLAALLLATVVFTPSYLPGCGPFFPEAVFTEKYHPPLPPHEFIRGRLGVLQPTYARRYLFVAYRYLTGKPLSSLEQESFINAVSNRGEFLADREPATPLKEWLDARRTALEKPNIPEIDALRTMPGDQWQSFVNCTDDAFQSAAKTLKARISTFGARHPGVKFWIGAQDQVFANCSGGRFIPLDPEAQLPKVFAQDRAYQIAAAYFYSVQYDEAAKLFRAIAADRDSPWSGIAPYLAVRCLVRKATLFSGYGKFDVGLLTEAENELKAFLQDESRRDLHPMARSLEKFIALRLHPLEQMRALDEEIRVPSNDKDFGWQLHDYLYLFDHLDYRTPFSPAAAQGISEMADWIITFQQLGMSPGEPLTHALERWRSTASPAWLLAAISLVDSQRAESAELTAGALKLPTDAPAFATAQYHRVRLLLASGRNDDARNAIDELLPDLRASLDPSSLNSFLVWRMALARNLAEFLEFAPRYPSSILYGEQVDPTTGKPVPVAAYPLFDADSVKVFNEGIPLSLLRRAAVSRFLPPHLHKQIVRAGWVKAILLADDAAAIELGVELDLWFPELRPELKAWRNAADAKTRQFAAAMLMLHFPGLSPFLQDGVPRRKSLAGIDDFRENWWCGLTVEGSLESHPLFRSGTWSSTEARKPANRPVPANVPGFLTEAERETFRNEWNRLAATETAANYIGKIVLAWAGRHPQDARVPEALHLVVKATRFGCNDENSGRYSRDAFQLLHRRYGNTKWAQMTPFWYR